MDILVEDLLLLLLDDSGRPVVGGGALDNALAGAVLVELAESGRVSPAGDAGQGRLLVGDTSPTGDPLLDRALDRLDAKGPVKAQRAVELLTKGVRQDVLERLADRGLVRPEKRKVLGLFPRTSWPVVAAERQREVRAGLSEVLAGRRAADAHLGGLVSLLAAIGALHKVVPGDRRQLEARAAEVGTAAWTGEAVRKAVEAVQAAVVAAVAASTAATAAGSSGGT